MKAIEPIEAGPSHVADISPLNVKILKNKKIQEMVIPMYSQLLLKNMPSNRKSKGKYKK